MSDNISEDKTYLFIESYKLDYFRELYRTAVLDPCNFYINEMYKYAILFDTHFHCKKPIQEKILLLKEDLSHFYDLKFELYCSVMFKKKGSET